MNAEQIHAYCKGKKGVTESFPFNETTLVFKVQNKMFALLSLDEELSINLKCPPEKVDELRERYSAVLPGYHMNKRHWNTVKPDNSIHWDILREWIDQSYNLIVESLPKKLREELKNMPLPNPDE